MIGFHRSSCRLSPGIGSVCVKETRRTVNPLPPGSLGALPRASTMKHAIYIIIIALLAFFSVHRYNVVERELKTLRTKNDSKIEDLQNKLNGIEDWRKEVFVDCNHKGRSNEPNYPDGACRFKIPTKSAEVGQMVSLNCYGKCSQKGEDYVQYLQKRIVKEENGCIWVEGDNKTLSYDSRYYGWLCEGDYEIKGVYLGTAEKYVSKLK